MTETSTKKPTHGVIKKLTTESCRLDVDDKLFYDILKSELDALIRHPHVTCIDKITSYSKSWNTPLV